MLLPRVVPRVAALLASCLAAGCAEDLAAPSRPSPETGVALSLAAVAAPPGHIRIGLVPEASPEKGVEVGGTGSYRVVDGVTGAVLLTGAADRATVTLVSVPVTRTFWRLQVSCTTQGAAFIADWVRRVEAAGYEPYTEWFESGATKCWRLRVGRFPTQTAALDANTRLYSLGISFNPNRPANFSTSRVSIVEGEPGYRATRETASAETTNPVRVVAVSGYVTIAGRPYRGVAEVRVNSFGTLAGINEVPIEEYLLGVVPRELPPGRFPYLEALKAQAVAARTYAYANLGKRKENGYDLLATPSDQVYGGQADEQPLSSQAVQGTAGVVATHGGSLISALYSSTSGGWTANSEDVFTSAEPYLRGVPDKERGNAFEHVPSLEVFRSHANPTSLRAAAEGDFESDWSRLHRWYVEWTAAEMRDVLNVSFKTEVGRVLAVNVTERSSSGRALRIEFVTENGTFGATKDGIRSALKFVTDAGTQTSLYSTLFFIQPVIDPRTKALTGFEAWGGGWGHGVGLSQTGAVGMAQRGDTHEQILKHYYRGIELETR